MTVLRASNAPVGIDQGKPVSTYTGITQWTRPSDWITYTEPTAGEQKVVGTVAVYNQDSNYLALLVTTTDASQYTVNWGDGTSTNHNSNTLAEKNYTWSSISSGTLTSGGYRQAIVTITPTTAGRTFATLQLSRRNTALATNTSTTSPWLDISISAPNATALDFSTTATLLTTDRLRCNMLEQVKILALNQPALTYVFNGMNMLQSAVINSTATLTSIEGLFRDCTSLVVAPPINTNSVVRTEQTFSGCTSLKSVPLYNLQNVTNTVSMFLNCRSLESVPLFTLSSVTSASTMFSGCTALKSVPAFNLSAATTLTSMFLNCTALQNVSLFTLNTSSAVNMGGMFNGCSSLETVPLFNTSAVTDMSNLFQNCIALKSLPLFNTAAVVNMTNLVYGCTVLESVPFFNTAAVTNMSETFRGCTALTTIPEFNLSSLVNMPFAFTGCRSLRELPALNVVGLNGSTAADLGIGNATINNADASLGRVGITNIRYTNSFQNCRMGATQLNELYTNLATLTHTVTNAVGNGTTVVYTVGAGNALVYGGRSVTITGVTPAAYNLTNVNVQSYDNVAGTFTVNNAATGTYVSGGTSLVTNVKTITVTGNPGTTTDNPAIATAKGWTITG